MPAPQKPVILPTARTFARMEAAAESAANDQASSSFPAEPQELPAGVMLGKNTTGDIGRFQVMGISGLVYEYGDNESEFKNNPSLELRTPTDDDRSGYAITQEPIKSGKIGRVMVAGVTPCQLWIVDTADTYADVNAMVSDDGMLYTGGGNARILWKQTGTGTGKWALVQFPNSGTSLWRFQLTASLSGGTASATISSMEGNAVTGTHSVTDVQGIFDTLESGDTGLCLLVGNTYHVIQAGC